jgi:membrane protease YdiL (CAAX protease family)
MPYVSATPGTSLDLCPRTSGWRLPAVAVVAVTGAVVADRALRALMTTHLGAWGWMVASTLLLGAVAFGCRRLRHAPLPRARHDGAWAWAVGLAVALGTFQLLAAAALPARPLPRSPFMALHLVVLVPVVEELAFRGVIHDALRSHLRVPVATLASAAIFAAAHPLGPQALWAFGLGIVLAVAYDRTQSLAVPIAGHAAYNLAAYGAALLFGL